MSTAPATLERAGPAIPLPAAQETHALPRPRARYRPEIDGLRTLAVVPVVLYHLGVPWVRAGSSGSTCSS